MAIELVCQNPDGECEIIGSTGEKPVKSRLQEDSVFFIAILIAYILSMLLRTENRIDRMSKRGIMQLTLVQQIILATVYIGIFFMLHRADAISRIVVGLLLIFSVAFCGIGRLYYHEYCQ